MIKTNVKISVNQQNPSFPTLLIDENDGMIILATSQNDDGDYNGTVVHLGKYREVGSGSLKVGTHQYNFSGRLFTQFYGEVSIQSS